MMRSAVAVFCVFCVATLMSQGLGVGLLWYRGQLTPEILRDIRLVLSGELPEAEKEQVEPEKPLAPSIDEVTAARVARLFDLTTREQELERIKALLTERADELAAQQQTFAVQRQEFADQLQQQQQAAADAAAEQARAVLLALPPADAVASLMALPLDENVLLLGGMPEKSIAKILKEFLQGGEQQAARGREIFTALSQGEPTLSTIETAAQRLDADGAAPNATAGTAGPGL